MWNSYFQEAEGQFEGQWKETIWPLIKDFDFGTVLELSPGAGRNTEKLSTLTSLLIAVDYNEFALEQARARLGTSRGGCEISYHRNNGFDLRMVPRRPGERSHGHAAAARAMASDRRLRDDLLQARLIVLTVCRSLRVSRPGVCPSQCESRG